MVLPNEATSPSEESSFTVPDVAIQQEPQVDWNEYANAIQVCFFSHLIDFSCHIFIQVTSF